MNIFKHTEEHKEFQSQQPYTCYLASTRAVWPHQFITRCSFSSSLPLHLPVFLPGIRTSRTSVLSTPKCFSTHIVKSSMFTYGSVFGGFELGVQRNAQISTISGIHLGNANPSHDVERHHHSRKFLLPLPRQSSPLEGNRDSEISHPIYPCSSIS